MEIEELVTEKKDKTRCSFKYCNNRGETNCPVCEKLFCNEHLEAVHPKKYDAKFGRRKNILDLESWHSEKGHPCALFAEKAKDYLPPEKTIKMDLEYLKRKSKADKFDEFLKDSKESIAKETSEQKKVEKKKTSSQSQLKKQEKELFENVKLTVYSVIAIGLIVLIIWQLFFYVAPNENISVFDLVNEKCVVFNEQACNSASVEVKGTAYSCLWDFKEEKCIVWWRQSK